MDVLVLLIKKTMLGSVRCKEGGKSLHNMQATCRNWLGRLSWLVKYYAWLRAATCFQPACYAWLAQNAAGE
jgi:hypothetical protein